MLNKLKKSNSEGFTIIEVMIVLAIAGLIILVVLLAVPALNRNARNTAIKNDAAAIAGGITEFASNNDGERPNASGDISVSSGTVTIKDQADPASKSTSAKIQGNTTVDDSISAAPTSIGAGAIQVWYKHACSGASSTRAAAIYYGVENNTSTPQVKCLDA